MAALPTTAEHRDLLISGAGAGGHTQQFVSAWSDMQTATKGKGTCRDVSVTGACFGARVRSQ